MFWDTFFSWPQGGVWSNLLASSIWAVLGYLWGRHHFRKLHQRHDYQEAKLKKVHKHLKEVHKHLGVADESSI